MSVDILLTIITLIVAVVGTILRDPSKRVKAFLIGLAVLASLGSIFKAINDEADKRFMKMALTSSLSPSNDVYKSLISDVAKVSGKSGLDQWNCRHNGNAMVCFLSSSGSPTKHKTLVLNGSEISKMYADELEKKANDSVINNACAVSYDPSKLEEDFKDKVGILGSAVSSDVYGQWPDYSYDDDIGVKHILLVNGTTKEFVITPDELRSLSRSPACDMFYILELRFREKYSANEATPPVLK